MASKPCCKGDLTNCIRNDDGTCTFTKKCTLKTSDGEYDCECICKCEGISSCNCDCKCTPETAQKIQTSDGVKFRCECTCKC